MARSEQEDYKNMLGSAHQLYMQGALSDKEYAYIRNKAEGKAPTVKPKFTSLSEVNVPLYPTRSMDKPEKQGKIAALNESVTPSLTRFSTSADITEAEDAFTGATYGSQQTDPRSFSTIGSTQGRDIRLEQAADGSGVYRLPGGGTVSFEGGRVGGGSFTGAGTDAEARRNLVTNLGLKDESQLKRDAFGNISNVADQYKRQLAELQEARRSNVIDSARSMRDIYQANNMTPELADQLVAEDDAQKSAELKAIRDYAVANTKAVAEELNARGDFVKADAEAKKIISEIAKSNSVDTRIEGVNGMMKTILEGFYADQQLTTEEAVIALQFRKMLLAETGDFKSLIHNNVVPREAIQAQADKEGISFGQAYQRYVDQEEREFREDPQALQKLFQQQPTQQGF